MQEITTLPEIVITSLVGGQDCATPLEDEITSLEHLQDNATLKEVTTIS